LGTVCARRTRGADGAASTIQGEERDRCRGDDLSRRECCELRVTRVADADLEEASLIREGRRAKVEGNLDLAVDDLVGKHLERGADLSSGGRCIKE
jgi:hypothetical protein